MPATPLTCSRSTTPTCSHRPRRSPRQPTQFGSLRRLRSREPEGDRSLPRHPRRLGQQPYWSWWWGNSSEAEWNPHAVGWFPEYDTLALPIYGSIPGATTATSSPACTCFRSTRPPASTCWATSITTPGPPQRAHRRPALLGRRRLRASPSDWRSERRGRGCADQRLSAFSELPQRLGRAWPGVRRQSGQLQGQRRQWPDGEHQLGRTAPRRPAPSAPTTRPAASSYRHAHL